MERMKTGAKWRQAVLIVLTALSLSGCFDDNPLPPKRDASVKKEPPPKPSPIKPKEVRTNDPVSDHWTEKGEQTLDGKTCSTWWMMSNVAPETYFPTLKTHVLTKWPKASFQSDGMTTARYQITVGRNAFDEDKIAQAQAALSGANNGLQRIDWAATVNADDQMNATSILKAEAEQVFALTSATLSQGEIASSGEAASLTVNSELAKDVLTYALLSDAIYKDRTGDACFAPINGWEPLALPKKIIDFPPVQAMPVSTLAVMPRRSSFYAQAFRKGGCVIVAFRGTELTDWGDIKTDVDSFLGGKPEQYQGAINFVEQLQKDGLQGVTNIKLTGHSLGGGLASYVAIHNGLPAAVFNAAGLGRELRKNVAKDMDIANIVRNIDVVGDPVSALGGQVGRIYELPIPTSWIGKDTWIDARNIPPPVPGAQLMIPPPKQCSEIAQVGHCRTIQTHSPTTALQQ